MSQNNCEIIKFTTQLVLKPVAIYPADVTLRLSSNMVGTNENNFLHNLLLADKFQVFCKTFANNSLVNINLSKTQLFKVLQSSGFLGRLFRPVMQGLSLMKNLCRILVKSLLIPLG